MPYKDGSKQYFWLKLKRDFFKRHDIRIVEDMVNGKDYILFYLKLLCESVDHTGSLRFSEEVPYNEEMLATITNTNIDVVRSAIKIFRSLKMLDVLDNGTIYMQEVKKMIGHEGFWAEKKRLQRAREDNVLQLSNLSNEELELELELDKDKIHCDTKNPSQPFKPPTLDEVVSYCKERANNVDANKFIDFYTAKGWMIGKNKMKCWKSAVRTWERGQNGTGTGSIYKKFE